MKKIVLTGGGTAGHVTPNIALIPELKKRGFEIYYIGSEDGIEKQLIEEEGIQYFGISSGKFRRYFDIKNFTDPFKVVKGLFQASKLIKKIQPNVVFSKGGFVTVPVVLAADRKKVPCILHESDMSPGLANRICIPHAVRVCTNFPEAAENIQNNKAVTTGTPIRKEMFSGNRIKGLDYCGLTANKPVILVMGGSLGAMAVNAVVREALPLLLDKFQVIHLCGTGKKEPSLENTKGYVQFEYVKKELADIMAAADLVISRAGANAICELVALGIPNILIPLPAASSRGDQVLNANSFAKQGFSVVLEEEGLSKDILVNSVHEVFKDRLLYKTNMERMNRKDSICEIVDIIEESCE